MISKVRYELYLVLTKGDTYEGRVVVDFHLSDKNLGDLYLDYHGQAIAQLVVNNVKIKKVNIQFSKHKVVIPRYNLKSNSLNRVSLKFTNKYVTNSAGFHRYVDPQDDEVYLYTHLEPFFCNRWFPCFDQPSIRAPLQLNVVTPDEKWQVVGNDVISQSIPVGSAIGKSLCKQGGI